MSPEDKRRPSGFSELEIKQIAQQIVKEELKLANKTHAELLSSVKDSISAVNKNLGELISGMKESVKDNIASEFKVVRSELNDTIKQSLSEFEKGGGNPIIRLKDLTFDPLVKDAKTAIIEIHENYKINKTGHWIQNILEKNRDIVIGILLGGLTLAGIVKIWPELIKFLK